MTVIIAMILFTTGCGSELAAGGGGLLGGFAASETMAGIEADLAAREQALIERYNEVHALNAKDEVLKEIEADIRQTVRLQQGVQAAKDVVGIVAETSGGTGSQAEKYGAIAAVILSLGLNIFQKRKGDIMKKTTRAIVKGIESAEAETKPNPTNPVKAAIKTQMQAAGIYNPGYTTKGMILFGV
jgi:hypothetical protein